MFHNIIAGRMVRGLSVVKPACPRRNQPLPKGLIHRRYTFFRLFQARGPDSFAALVIRPAVYSLDSPGAPTGGPNGFVTGGQLGGAPAGWSWWRAGAPTELVMVAGGANRLVIVVAGGSNKVGHRRRRSDVSQTVIVAGRCSQARPSRFWPLGGRRNDDHLCALRAGAAGIDRTPDQREPPSPSDDRRRWCRLHRFGRTHHPNVKTARSTVSRALPAIAVWRGQTHSSVSTSALNTNAVPSHHGVLAVHLQIRRIWRTGGSLWMPIPVGGSVSSAWFVRCGLHTHDSPLVAEQQVSDKPTHPFDDQGPLMGLYIPSGRRCTTICHSDG